MTKENPIRILVADDEASFLTALLTYLNQDHREILVAHDGTEAVRILDENPPLDIVVTDLVMPGVDGIGVLGKALEVNRRTLVILMTGFRSIDAAMCAMKQGAFDFKTKPFLLEEMGLSIKRAEGQLRLAREMDLLRVEKNALRKHVAKLQEQLARFRSLNLDPIDAVNIKGQLDILEKKLDVHRPCSSYQYGDPENKDLQEDFTILKNLKEQGAISLEEYRRLNKRLFSNEGVNA